MNLIDECRGGLSQLLEQREQFLKKLPSHISTADTLIKKTENLNYEESVFATKSSAQNLHQLIKTISGFEKLIGEKKIKLRNLLLNREIVSPLSYYKESVTQIYTYDSAILPELAVISLTRLFYVVHKKKTSPSPKDMINLRLAQIYANATYNPAEERLEIDELIKAEISSFEKCITDLKEVRKL